MSLGDLVISLSANTARFDSDMGRAAQMMEAWGNRVYKSVDAGEKAIAKMSSMGVKSVDRLQRAFNTLNLKSAFQIDNEASRVQAAFEKIKNSGVASADEISRAQKAMKQHLDNLHSDGTPKVQAHFNAWGIGSMIAIAKIQVLYSLVNQVMSAIGSLPKTAVGAIEDFNSSVISGAAMITSMQSGVTDIGKAYQENKRYAEGVQNVLIKMDSETAASAKNLNDMNTQFMQQGILIDTNNKKQIDGFKNIANALSAITANDPNKDMQFAQEIRALRDMQDKGSNRLVQLLKSMDPDIKAHLEQWKAIGKETGNYGYVLEKIGPMLKGFAAAQGDINNLWETVKSTMATIRDEVLRGGLSAGFAEIVQKMKEISKYAEENKEKVQAFLKKGLEDAIAMGKLFGSIGSGIAKIGEPLVWSVITLGIYSAVKAMSAFAIEVTTATGGINLILAGLATIGVYAGKKYFENQGLDDRVKDLKAKTLNGAITRDQLQAILQNNPLATNDDIVKWKEAGAIKFGSNFYMNQMAIRAMKEDKEKAFYPKDINSSGKDSGEDKLAETYKKYSDLMDSFNKRINEANPYLSKVEDKIKAINDEVERAIKKEGMSAYAKSIREAGENLKANIIESDEIVKTNEFIEKSVLQLNVALLANKKINTDLIYQSKAEKPSLLDFKDITKPKFGASLNGPVSSGWGQIPVDAEKEALELRNIQEAALKNDLLLIDAKERLNELSGSEALKQRIPLEQKLATIQKEYLESIDKFKDPSAWHAANAKYIQDITKVNEDIQKLYSSTFSGGMTNAIKKYGDEASNVGKQIEIVFTNAFKNIEDSIVSAFQKGKIDGKAMIQAIQADLIRMFVAKPVTDALAKSLDGIKNWANGASDNNNGGNGGVGIGTYAAMAVPVVGMAVAAYSFIDSMQKAGEAEDEKRKQEIVAMAAVKRAIDELNGSLDVGVLAGSGQQYAAEKLDLENKQIKDYKNMQIEFAQAIYGGTIIPAISEKYTKEGLQSALTDFINVVKFNGGMNTWSAEPFYGEGYGANNIRGNWIDKNSPNSLNSAPMSAADEFKKNTNIINDFKQQISMLEKLEQIQKDQDKALENKQALNKNNLLLQELDLKGLKQTSSYVELLAKVREAEMYNLDDTNKAIQRRINLLQDEKDKTERINKEVSDYQSVQLKFVQTISDTMKTVADKLKTQLIDKVSLSLSALQTLANLKAGNLSILSPQAKYQGLQARYSAADDTHKIELAQQLLEASQSYNASGAGYQFDYKMVTEDMARIGGLPDIADKSYVELQTQTTYLEKIKNDLSANQFNQTTSLSSLLGQSATLNTYMTEWFNAQADANKAATVASAANSAAISTVGVAEMQAAANSLTNDAAADLVGKMALGVKAVDLAWDLNKSGSVDYADTLLALQGKRPKFAMGGLHSGGLRIVGENGPELEATGPSRIWNADQTKGILANGAADNRERTELKEANRQLTAIVRVLQAGFNGTIGAVESSSSDRAGYNQARLQAAR